MNRMSRCNYPDSWWMTPSTCVDSMIITKSACIMIATMMVIRHLSFADLPTLSESHNRGIATCFSSFRTSQTQLCGSGVCSDALSVVLPTVSFGVSQASCAKVRLVPTLSESHRRLIPQFRVKCNPRVWNCVRIPDFPRHDPRPPEERGPCSQAKTPELRVQSQQHEYCK